MFNTIIPCTIGFFIGRYITLYCTFSNTLKQFDSTIIARKQYHEGHNMSEIFIHNVGEIAHFFNALEVIFDKWGEWIGSNNKNKSNERVELIYKNPDDRNKSDEASSGDSCTSTTDDEDNQAKGKID